MEAQLICEGQCNPGIARIDDLLRRVGREAALQTLNEFYAKAGHTKHFAVVSDVMWRCLACGHVRRFGGNDRPAWSDRLIGRAEEVRTV